MCGIIGVASSRAVQDRDWLGKGSNAMAHRGPDDSGVWWSLSRNVGLAQRRLAIIDLSLGGHQPMHDNGGWLSIVFNGEIYNYLDLRNELVAKGHTFRSQSDTEVIIAAYREWGTDCLVRFNGMFAIALYDAKNSTLFLARDRAGEKPLFYSLVGGELRFASELKGLLADPNFDRSLCPIALDCYLAMGYVPGDLCMLKGAHKLPPAHAMLFDLASGKSEVWRYWQLPEARTFDARDDEELVDELEALLADAVKRQLIADVPVGVLLSGGVDSSLVTAMAARVSSRVKTFTVGFEGYGNYDESAFARLIADHFGTEHMQLQAEQTEPDILDRLARQFDEPLNDSSMIPTFLVSQLVRKYCTVALGGDGGDEMFGGYEHHRRLLWMKSRADKVPLMLRRLVPSIADTALPTGFKGRNWLQAWGANFDCELPAVNTHFGPAERRALMGKNWRLHAENIREARIPCAPDLLQRVTRMDFLTYMPEDILVKVDRASMFASLEMRAPLLDFRVAEFAFGKVPSRLKTNFAERKILLKRLSKRVLPPSFDAERKQGFSIPLPIWMRAGVWRDFVSGVLLDPSCIFDRGAISDLLEGHGRRRNNAERLFGLTVFELWRRAYAIH